MPVKSVSELRFLCWFIGQPQLTSADPKINLEQDIRQPETVLGLDTILEYAPMAPLGSQNSLNHDDFDPEFLQSRREMIVILVAFFCSLLWTMGVSFAAGYPQSTEYQQGDIDPSQITLVWGLPSWVFWGILTPWLVIDLVAVWFCFFYMQDYFPHQSADAPDVTVSEAGQTIEERHER